MLTAEPKADLEVALAEWRRYRRRKRLADVHWIDAMYQAYMAAIFGAVALYFLASAVGDGPLTPGPLARVAAEGDDWLGVVVVIALAVGLRSGSRGGPLALERAEVRHVLLAPVDRTTTVRARCCASFASSCSWLRWSGWWLASWRHGGSNTTPQSGWFAGRCSRRARSHWPTARRCAHRRGGCRRGWARWSVSGSERRRWPTGSV